MESIKLCDFDDPQLLRSFHQSHKHLKQENVISNDIRHISFSQPLFLFLFLDLFLYIYLQELFYVCSEVYS